MNRRQARHQARLEALKICIALIHKEIENPTDLSNCDEKGERLSNEDSERIHQEMQNIENLLIRKLSRSLRIYEDEQ